MTYWLGYLTVLILGTILCLSLIKFFYRTGRPISKTGVLIGNFTLSLIAIFLTCMAIEFYFKVFFAQSDAYVFSLSAQNWLEHYWHPINSLGYRDREWSEQEVAGKLKVMVVGDSVAAGLGINNYQDRFSNKLNDLLGDEAVVFNVASPGWHTRQEIEAVINYPYRPDILILAYFVNDIEGSAFHQGLERPRFVKDPPPILRLLIENSYALNFLYWRWVRLGQQEGQADYLRWVSDTFNNPDVWWIHQQELQTIYEGAQAEGITLIVVVFPNLTSMEESWQITEPVLNFFQERHIATLDVAKLIENRRLGDLMVSPVDAHPNEALNLIVAEHLYHMIRASGSASQQAP